MAGESGDSTRGGAPALSFTGSSVRMAATPGGRCIGSRAHEDRDDSHGNVATHPCWLCAGTRSSL